MRTDVCKDACTGCVCSAATNKPGAPQLVAVAVCHPSMTSRAAQALCVDARVGVLVGVRTDVPPIDARPRHTGLRAEWRVGICIGMRMGICVDTAVRRPSAEHVCGTFASILAMDCADVWTHTYTGVWEMAY